MLLFSVFQAREGNRVAGMERETRATGMQQEVAVTNRRHTLFILAIRSSSVSIYEALTKRTRSSNTDLY